MDEEKRREREAEAARRAKIKDRIARHKGKEEAARAAKVCLPCSIHAADCKRVLNHLNAIRPRTYGRKSVGTWKGTRGRRRLHVPLRMTSASLGLADFWGRLTVQGDHMEFTIANPPIR